MRNYYLTQAKQKGGNLKAFHGSRFQRGYGLGSIFKGLFYWALSHIQLGAKVLGKKGLQTVVNRELRQEDFSRRHRDEISEGTGLTSSFLSRI